MSNKIVEVKVKIGKKQIDKVIKKCDNYAIGFAYFFLDCLHLDEYKNKTEKQLIKIYKNKKGL